MYKNGNPLFPFFIKILFIYYFSIVVLLKCMVSFLGKDFFLSNIVFLFNIAFFVIIVTISLFIYIRKFTYYRHNIYINLFLFLFSYMLFSLLYNSIFGELYITNNVVLFQSKVIVYALLNILLGMHFYQELNESNASKIYIYVFVIYTLFIIWNINFERLTFQIDYISGEHQLFSDVFVVFSCFIVFFIRFKVGRLLFMTFILVVLFLIKSRATFFSFLIVYVLFIVKEIGLKNSVYLFIFFIILSLFMIVNDDSSLDRRMFGVFQGKYDSSLNERIAQFKYGIEAIKNNWFWGEYAGQIIVHKTGYESGTMGAYMHNLLSFWRQFGLLFFLIFMITYCYGLYKISLEWKNSDSFKIQFIFYVSLFLLIELLLFRSYTFPYFWFSLGLMYTHLHTVNVGKFNAKK